MGKWESGIGTSYHQILQMRCVPPRSAASTSCEHRRRPPLLIQHRQGNYAKYGLAPCRRTPPIPLLRLCDFECSKSCDVVNFFNFFNFSTCRPSTFVSHHSIHLFGHQSMLVASNAPSDPPRLVFTSVLLHRCRIPCCHQILTFGEEILAWNPAPGNPLSNARRMWQPRAMKLPIGSWNMDIGMRNTTDRLYAKMALVFLLFARWKSFVGCLGKIDRWIDGSMDQWTHMDCPL